MKKIFSFLFLISSVACFAQEQKKTEFIVVEDILVNGNKKTKDYIVIRELDFTIGDTLLLADLPERFEGNKKWFVNKDVFNEIEFNIGDWDFETHQAVIKLEVKESWYIYPIPLVELADRNFNIWWDEHHHSLKRINLGLTYFQNNLSGRLDRLVVLAQSGYTQKAEVEYFIPYFNKKKTIGFRAKISYIRNKTVGYKVDSNYNELFRFKEEDFSHQRFRTTLDWVYRPNIRLTHTLLTGFHHNRISHFVVDSLNYDFFGNGNIHEKYPSLGYQLRRDKRDINLYSMEGSLIEFHLNYEGAFKGYGPKKWSTSLFYGQYLKFSEKWSTELIGKGTKTLYFGNPNYAHRFSLGGLDYIRGYEYYVLNGQDYLYGKTSLRYRLVKKPIPLKKWVGFKDIDFRLFLSINNDVGKITEHHFPDQNALSDKWLWGKGIGLDFVFYESRAIQVEYTFNHLREKGLFLHIKLFN